MKNLKHHEKKDLFLINLMNSKQGLILSLLIYFLFISLYNGSFDNFLFCMEDNENVGKIEPNVYQKLAGCGLFVASILFYFLITPDSPGVDPGFLAETGMRLINGTVLSDTAIINLDGISVNNIPITTEKVYISADCVLQNFINYREHLLDISARTYQRNQAILLRDFQIHEDMFNNFFKVLIDKNIIDQELVGLYSQLLKENNEQMFGEILEGFLKSR